MAVALIVTPGSATANSYATAAVATAFFANDYQRNAAWAALSTDDAARLLIGATAAIDRWIGNNVSPSIRISTHYYESALKWPFVESGATVTGSAESGSGLTTLKNASFKDYPDDWWIGGAVLIYDVSDDTPPMGEIRGVTDSARVAYTLTCATFSAAIEAGDSFVAIRPVPSWLRDATCLQAFYARERRDGMADLWSRGVASQTGSPESQSITLHTPGRDAELAHDVIEILTAHIPRAPLGRA